MVVIACRLRNLPRKLTEPNRRMNYALELRSWMAAPDAEQSALRDAALDSLRAGAAASRC